MKAQAMVPKQTPTLMMRLRAEVSTKDLASMGRMTKILVSLKGAQLTERTTMG